MSKRVDYGKLFEIPSVFQQGQPAKCLICNEKKLYGPLSKGNLLKKINCLFSFEKSLCYRTIFEYFEEKIPLQHVQVIDLNTEMPTKKIKLSDFSIKSTKQRTDWRTYLAQYLETPAINGANHFDFWNKTELDESFKNLIFQILAIPSSSGAVERLFSQCNLRCSDRKNRIKPQTLENLVLIATFQ